MKEIYLAKKRKRKQQQMLLRQQTAKSFVSKMSSKTSVISVGGGGDLNLAGARPSHSKTNFDFSMRDAGVEGVDVNLRMNLAGFYNECY